MTSPEPTRRNGAYLDVDGVVTYFEVTGGGEALILLHGGMGTAEECDAQATKLAETFRVYVPERYGHGRTPDIAGDITYENMAEHTVAFMETLGIESAHLVGWSDGALVGLLVALRRPELVRKLVLIDQFVSLDGARAEVQEEIASMTLDDMAESVAVYNELSPDGPDHFPVVFDKIHKLWTDETGIDLADLERVTARTLLLVADEGVMTLDHAHAMAEALSDSHVVVVPGTTHNLPNEKPDLVNQYILDFLATAPAAAAFAGYEP